jgi:hypothetical protein
LGLRTANLALKALPIQPGISPAFDRLRGGWQEMVRDAVWRVPVSRADSAQIPCSHNFAVN